MLPTNQTCKTCGNTFTGNYCNKCGEKVYTEHDKSVFHIADEVFHFVTHFEGNFLTTTKTIFTRPGKLAYDYCNGSRKKYFKPISFLLLCIVLYLLFPKFDGLNMKFYNFASTQNNYSWLAKPVVKKKMQSSAISLEQLNEKYNHESTKISKIFLLTLIPLTALLLYLLFYTKHRYYFDHFIMATEFISVLVIIVFLLLPLLVVICGLIYPPSASFFGEGNTPIFIIVHLILLSFLARAFKRFYQQNWFLTILKSIVLLIVFDFGILYVYHCLLFLLIMLLI
ncbi:MAG: DUF3667 domain-containing protein [Chitinophagaceae bacterium]